MPYKMIQWYNDTIQCQSKLVLCITGITLHGQE